jgi:signal transduction histidine kinase
LRRSKFSIAGYTGLCQYTECAFFTGSGVCIRETESPPFSLGLTGDLLGKFSELSMNRPVFTKNLTFFHANFTKIMYYGNCRRLQLCGGGPVSGRGQRIGASTRRTAQSRSPADPARGGKAMTIRKRILHSNIRMALLTVFAFFVAGFTMRSLVFNFVGLPGPSPEKLARARELMASEEEWEGIVWWLSLSLFLTLIGIFNNFSTYHLTKKIVKPLGPLIEGARHIQNNNFSYRIEYREEDEFRAVCDAFNEMAAKLEEATVRRQNEEANRRELIAGISHDLRTPLTTIKGYLEGLESGVASTPKMREHYLKTIKNRAGDMGHIIEQLFLFSKLDMNEFPLAAQQVDIGRAISDMIEDLAHEYEMRGIDIVFSEMAHNAVASVDTFRLRNVIVNILENSARYKTEERGSVTIGVSAADDSVLLRFADDGPGVSADALPRLFDVFYRADPSRNKKGSGLGLAISAKTIERMGGAIHAELPAAGGLAIVISLPLMEKIA